MKKNKDMILGWREWFSLPEMGIKKIKVKVDTGARTSALHAKNVKIFSRGGKQYVEFDVNPSQDKGRYKRCRALLVEKRKVISSNGEASIRPVIETLIRIGEHEWPVEVTLVNRDIMGFRMLLGRQAIRGHFFVDPGRSFIFGPGKSTKTKATAKLKR